MRHPFLENNQLVLIDYVPGSSGQLLIRLWSELDAKMGYDNPAFLTETGTSQHPASREIDYDILYPKKLVNWFIDRCEPRGIEDHASYFDFLGTCLIASSEKWNRDDSPKFYKDPNYNLEGRRVIYGMHSWSSVLPFKEMQDEGYGIRHVSIVPRTKIGKSYQYARAQICYPGDEKGWRRSIDEFNSKHVTESFDFCTPLVNRDTETILSWLGKNLGNDFRHDKISWVENLLDLYYDAIVSTVEI